MMNAADFPYGYRQTTSYDRHGQPSYAYAPLQLEDFLNPQEDDHFNHGPVHDGDVDTLYKILQRILQTNPFITILRGQKFDWGIPDLAQPAPDLAIVPDLLQSDERRDVFDVVRERTLPRTIIEVTSPHFADFDLIQKREIYQKVGVPEYIIIDTGLRTGNDAKAYRVVGHTLVDGEYQLLESDEQGFIHSTGNQLRIGATQQRDDFIVIDARTNQPVVPDDTNDRVSIQEVQGNQRAKSIESALDFLRSG